MHVSKWVEEPPRTVPDGCVFITVKGAGVGKLFQGLACAIGRDIYAFKPNTFIEYGYLMWALRSVIEEIKMKASGDIPGLSKGDLLEHDIPLFPLAEQRRIVAKLDALQSRTRIAREALDAVAPLLKSFRQSVLQAAATGALTEEWRSKQKNIAEWEPVVIGDLLLDKPRNGYSPKSVDRVTAVKSLSLSATTSGRFRPECFKYIDETISDESYLWLQPGDILIQRANTIEYVGVSAIFDGPEKAFIYPDLMMKCRANSCTTPQYLHLLLSSNGVRQYYRENATGTAGNMPKINQETVTSAPAELPPLAEQTEIVRRVQHLFAMADAMEAEFEAAQRSVDQLDQSLLATAFRGELVPQDPSEEPASVLLERIRAARATLAEAKGKRGRKLARKSEATVSRACESAVPRKRGRPRKA